jgi:inhibitor of cysteine peptidase
MLFFKKENKDDNESKLFATEKLKALDDNINYPEKLSQGQITAHIAPIKVSDFNYQRAIRYSAALAVCFVFVVGVVLSLSTLKKIDTTATGTVTTAKNYDDVTNAFKTIYKNNANQNFSGITFGMHQTKGALAPATNGNEKSAATAQAITNAPVSGTTEFSTTNLQVDGVDEGDIVKNDGSYIYTLLNNKVSIADVRDPKNMKLVSTLTFDNSNAVDMYVYKNKLIVVLDQYQNNVANSAKKSTANTIAIYNYNNQTKVMVYDITDRSKPKEFRNFSQDGSFVSSRMIGNNIYVASSYYAYVKDTGNITAEQIIPKAGDGTQQKMIPADNIFIPTQPQNASYAVVSGINVDDANVAASTVACVGSAGNVFTSLNNLYLTSQRAYYSLAIGAPSVKKGEATNSPSATIGKATTDGAATTGTATVNGTATASGTATTNEIKKGAMIAAPSTNQETTDIIRLNLNNGKVAYTGTCTVNGNINNQFSMDEYNGFFRIATTTYSPDMKNNLYIFDSKMKLTGSIEGMAKGENIHSVRFMSNRAYIVTFRTVDPLFAIDLTNPKAPKVLGELKIPGFSDYLQPYSDNLIIGFGKDALESGNMAYYQGLKLSLFDVSDPLNPKELFSYHIGDRGSTSPVLNDHRALLFDKDKNIIGFPVTIMQLSDGAKNDIHAYGSFKYDGYYVMSVDPNKGFSLLGSVTNGLFTNHGSLNESMLNLKNLCVQGLLMQRGAYIGNVLYTISNAKIVASSLVDFSKLGELSLPFYSETVNAGTTTGGSAGGMAIQSAPLK